MNTKARRTARLLRQISGTSNPINTEPLNSHTLRTPTRITTLGIVLPSGPRTAAHTPRFATCETNQHLTVRSLSVPITRVRFKVRSAKVRWQITMAARREDSKRESRVYQQIGTHLCSLISLCSSLVQPFSVTERECLEQVRRPRNQIEDWGTTKHNFVHERPPFFPLPHLPDRSAISQSC